MKKLISMLLVATLLFNFIFCNQVYASSQDASYTQDDPNIKGSDLEQGMNDGIWDYAGSAVKLALTPFSTLFGTIAGILAAFFNLFPSLLQFLMKVCVGESFLIEKAVFGEIAIFDVNYFNTSEPYQYTIGNGTYETTFSSDNNMIISLRNSVAKYYYILRLIAVAIALLVLIYVGIRMTISTIADDKAKYKKMLIGWIESIVILFLLQYIIVIIFGVGKIFEDLIYNLKCILQASGDISFESQILAEIQKSMLGKAGWNYVLYSVMFWVLVYIQTKFFLLYYKRLITVGFLILIAPLITVTYPIDKLGDGKAQAFSVWLNEMMMNVFIQPIHAIIYLVFMFTAGEIAKHSIWIAFAFLLVLTKIEKIILRLFDLRKVTSLKPIDEQRKD